MRRSTLIAAGAALSLALVLPGAASAQTNPPLVWTTPVAITNIHGPFAYAVGPATSVSCPSASLCVAGDANGGISTTTNPGARPTTWTRAPIPQALSLDFMSCPTTTFCLALSEPSGSRAGPFRIFTSTNPTGGAAAWAQDAAHPAIGAIACASSKLCVIGGNGQISISTDPAAGPKTAWKVTAKFPALSEIGITGMSCSSLTFCVGVDEAGDVYSSADPTGGASAWKVVWADRSAGLEDLTCPSASFCAALDTLGKLAYSTHPAGGASAWHVVTAPVHITGLACLSATFCTARNSDINTQGPIRDPAAFILTTTNPAGGSAAWQLTRADPLYDHLTGLTCATPTLCAAVDNAGDALTSVKPAAGPSAWRAIVINGLSSIVSLGCPSVNLCVAGDDAGNILTSTTPGGGAAGWHQVHLVGTLYSGRAFASIDAISCPSTSLCLASTGDNVFWSTNPTDGAPTWSGASVPMRSISCPTTSLCVATGAGGNIVTSTNPTGGASAWQAASVAKSGYLVSVTCPSPSLCVATDQGGNILTSTNPTGGASAWQASAAFFDSTIGPMTCPTATFCVAIGLDFTESSVQPAIFSSHNPTGGTADWQVVSVGPVDGDDSSGGTISCPSASFCLAEFAGATGVTDLLASTDPASSSASAWLDTGMSVGAVSCLTASMCVAGTFAGQVQVGTTPLATKTTITSVTKSRIVGQPIEVSVRVAATTTGPSVPTPGGTVTVTMSHSTCTAQLAGSGGVATGECAITPRAPGTYHIDASYGSQSPYGGSQASSVPVTVVQARTSTVLTLSDQRVTYGHEHSERLTVIVHPQFAGVPAGTVVIKVKTMTICTRRLSDGTATCRLTRKQLRPGRYQLTAHYSGNSAFIKSTSAAERLRVFR